MLLASKINPPGGGRKREIYMMSRHEALSNGENTSRQPSKFEQILGKMPNFFEHMKKTAHRVWR